MRLLLRLSALLAVAALVALAAGAQVTGRIVPVPDPVTYPQDGVFVYSADPTCPGVNATVPALAPAVCMRAKALEWLRDEVRYSRVTPGPAWRDCTYPGDPNWGNCLEFAFRGYTPEIRYGQSAKWVYGLRAGVPMWVCATGIAYSSHIRVSLAHSTYRLVAWETLNSALNYRPDRRDLTDTSAVVGVGTNWAAAACGVN